MKILIVDDKEEALYLLDAMLKASGYEIVSARNGVEALKVLRENTVDMIISDILMPKMDGFQLCRECKGDDTLREIPFVFYTATYTDKKDEEFALSLGAEKFMVKPVEPREFMDMIQLVLEEHRKGTLVAPKKPIEEEAVYLAQYNERLIKKLEKKMQELEMAHKNLNQIFETLGSGIRVIDKDFNTLRVNRAFSSLSGVEEDEAVGKKCHQVFPGPQCHTPDCTLTRILSGEERVECEAEKRCSDGTNIPCILVATGLRASNGELVGIVTDFTDITERKQTEEEIKASLREKELLLREIHHRVRNNMQVISSLFDMGIRRTDNQETITFFQGMRSRIHTMSLIHSQLYQSDQFDKVDMGRHVRDLTIHLSQIYAAGKRITPVVEAPDIYLSITQAIPCSLVLNELISNVYKHAFRDREEGRIEVSLKKSGEDTLLMKVKDDGIGIAQEIDIDKANTLGLKITKSIVQDQLQGNLELKRDKGTEIIMEFKIVPEKRRY